MRILIVGSDKVYAIENFYVRYLPESGMEVRLFPAQSLFYDFYQQSLFNKLFFKSGLSGIYQRINRQFREMVDLFRPDLIWVFKGMEITPSSLRWVREKGIKLVNYNPDNPFIFTGKGSGNKNIKRSLALYDLHLTYNLDIQKEMEDRHHLRTDLLPFGFDLDDELYQRCSREQEVNKLCFLGNPDEKRAAFIEGLAKEGILMDVYGNRWKQFVDHPGVTAFDPVYADEFWKVLRKYRVQLNLMRIHNENSHNMRSFEIPGAGGIMLAPATTEHRIFFTDRQDAFLFEDLRDCVRQATAILRLTESEAGGVRQRARQRSLSSGYSYRDRSRSVAGKLQLL